MYSKRSFYPAYSGNFFAIGLSYLKADAEVRGHFSVDMKTQDLILQRAQEDGIDGLTIISTCNRTELYGFADEALDLIKLLCEHTQGTVAEFQNVSYTYENEAAVDHLFKVGTGLDSQILGDFEIIGQLKSGFKRSKKLGLVNPFMERLINCVIQSSKRIKNETNISNGATSVSFASVQYIMARVPYISEKNIVLFGTGKIGRNTCENLVKHTKNDHITLINRTKDKAEKIAGRFNLLVKDYADIQSEIASADVLIVATGAQKPTISKDLLHLKKPLLILDLSIPKNVDSNVEEIEHVTLVHLDQLSKITDDTLNRRKQHVPQAEAINKEIQTDFYEWLGSRQFAPTIRALKSRLLEIKDGEIDFQRKKIVGFNEEQAEIISNRLIQKIATQFAKHLKDEKVPQNESIELIQKVFKLQNH
ncbi:glutamyl-tRNA reductase [Flavimarina sp. Hel_I_48]|uniref:glutamyl-tRNA reductase n=1 Tax=Flavimarina sp. Hel_I_48 TaxID=1392488 RepID=UPI0004DEECFA|nr:glutamyl-tRNA reductase [Flavimarina sp. Hel_I_48]